MSLIDKLSFTKAKPVFCGNPGTSRITISKQWQVSIPPVPNNLCVHLPGNNNGLAVIPIENFTDTDLERIGLEWIKQLKAKSRSA